MKTPFAIALRIALIIFSILSVTLGLAFGASEYELTRHYVDIFEARRDVILTMPDTLSNLSKEPRRMRLTQDQGVENMKQKQFPPLSDAIGLPANPEELRDGGKSRMQMGISRNIIIENASGSVTVYGNLRSESVSREFIRSLPENAMIERSLEEDDAYFFYAFSLPSGARVVLYEPLEFLKTMRGNYALISIVGLFFFSILLFVVSYRIAKDSLKPLEEAMERSRSYNRYMAHELKTPIAVISSNLELAKRSKDPISYVDSSLDELSGMKSSIDKLLFLSGKEFQLQVKKTPIKPILDSLIWELGKLFGREDISWKTEISGVEILTDSAFFRLFARNILENIFKYAKSGEVRIISNKHEIVFENPADPIESAKLASFFEASESYGGKWYGIGLSIVKRIADLHKWKVTLESEDGVFRVRVGV